MTEKIYKPIIKKFLGKDVRIVNDDYIVLKDCFNALGRLTKDGKIETTDRNKVRRYQEMNIICGSETFTTTSKTSKSKSRETQQVECIRLSDISILFIQFEPTARVGKEAHDTWVKFMKFVVDLLDSLECYKYIITDKENQKDSITRLCDNEGKPMVANQMVNKIMGVLILGEEVQIKEDELKIYQPQTTIDLLTVRQYVLDKFVNAYEFTGSHKESYNLALKLAKKKYPLAMCNRGDENGKE